MKNITRNYLATKGVLLSLNTITNKMEVQKIDDVEEVKNDFELYITPPQLKTDLEAIEIVTNLFKHMENDSLLIDTQDEILIDLKPYFFKVLNIETKETELWSIDAILHEINRDRSQDWDPYNENDWIEGWKFFVEGDYYMLLDK
jgi:hypothetical protein